ncbi:MAG: PQQ-dependent sugar dehydrogenase [Caldilineaceae bacterium]|nr:PQQ-dependent sugar dehydrogenase [Caldilineaceae bacterium]
MIVRTIQCVSRFAPRMSRIALLLITFSVLQLVLSPRAWGQDASGDTISLPPGFTVSEVRGLNFPTDMAFLPSGDLLILEKGTGDGPDGSAAVRVLLQNGTLRSAPVITLPTTPLGDSGLLGLAVDPDFAANGFIYIWHATGAGSPGWSGETVNRLSRFTVDRVTLTADPADEAILLDNVPWWIMHNGGGLGFDAAGRLYLSIGDTTRSETAQRLDALTGKLLRIIPAADGYVIPADNPFVDTPDARPEIYALGQRNPFRLAVNPADDLAYVADVGNDAWEETNRAVAGANFGWPVREGPCPFNEFQPCAPASSAYVDPILYYAHDADLGASITGLDFYAGSEFPAEYDDRLFFADLNLGTIESATFTDGGFEIHPFAAGAPGIVDLAYWDEKLYYLQIYGGKVGVIAYTGIPNQLPVAAISADVTLAPSPLTVHFDAGASADEDGAIAAYRWDFGDGSALLTTTVPAASHTYAEDGAYTAQLVVADDDGAASEAALLEIQAYSGEPPAIALTNLTEAGRALFYGGDAWEYAAVRPGGTTDLDPETPFEWRIDMHHNQHTHPIVSGQTTADAVFDIDTDNHGGAWNIWYRFHLFMHTAGGQQVHVSADIRPALVSVDVASEPAGTDIRVNGGRVTTPYAYQAVAGTEHTLQAASEILRGREILAFDKWQVEGADGGGNLTDPIYAFTIPGQSATYTATYRFDRAAETVYLPLVASR